MIGPETLMSFRRAVAPETIATEDLGQPKCLAIKPTSSALALLSTGAERRRAVQAPDSSASSELMEERGFARTAMMNESSPGEFAARGFAMPGSLPIADYAQPQEPPACADSSPCTG